MKKMDIPEIGKFIRKIRIDNEETGPQMGERLGVSKTYISAIELGKRMMSNKIRNRFIKEYNLTTEQIYKFDELMSLQSKYIRIDVSKMKDNDIKLLIALSKKIKYMSHKDNEIIELLTDNIHNFYEDDKELILKTMNHIIRKNNIEKSSEEITAPPIYTEDKTMDKFRKEIYNMMGEDI